MADQIAQLQNYWIKLAADDAGIDDLDAAQTAMGILMGGASRVPWVRGQFVQANIFNLALDKDRGSDALLKLRKSTFGSSSLISIQQDTPLAMMIKGIQAASEGSWMLPKVAGGVVPWVATGDGPAFAISNALTDDAVSDDTRAALLRFLIDVPIPVSWAKVFHNQNTFKRVERNAAGSNSPPTIRLMMQNLALQASSQLAVVGSQIDAGVIIDEARAASATAPDGAQVPVTGGKPPPPWYRKPGVGRYFAAGAGLLLGALYQRRAH